MRPTMTPRQESLRIQWVNRVLNPVNRCPIFPAHTSGAVPVHAAQRDDGQSGVPRQQPKACRTQRSRAGVRTGGEYRRKQDRIGAGAACMGDFPQRMRGDKARQGGAHGKRASCAIDAVRAQCPRLSGIARQHDAVPKPSRKPRQFPEPREPPAWPKLVMSKDQPGPPWQAGHCLVERVVVALVAEEPCFGPWGGKRWLADRHAPAIAARHERTSHPAS